MSRIAPVLALLLAGCDAPDERAAWLQTTLVDDNHGFMDSDPVQGQAKLARMSLDRYAFFRGTLPQFARDLADARYASAYATEQTADVALIGDPHPENIGSFRGADGALVIDFNDFDAATYGPYTFDLRRLALGFHTAGVVLEVGDPEALAEAAAAGYVDEIVALARSGGVGTVMAAGADHGEILNHTLRKAAKDGAAREELKDYTRVADGQRAMFFGVIEPGARWRAGAHAMRLAGDEVVAPTGAERARVAAVLAAWPVSLHDPSVMSPGAGALKGVSRRLGAGIASYAAPRFYALLEGPTPALADDLLLEIKQVYDAPAVPGAGLVARPFADNGARVVAQQRALQTTAQDDRLLGHARVGGASYRVRDRTKFQRGVDLAKISDKLEDGDFEADDLVVLADRAGHLLARCHALAPRSSGEPGLPAIAAAVGRDPAGLVAETLAFVDAYAPVLADDHARFLALLAAEGPSLGYLP